MTSNSKSPSNNFCIIWTFPGPGRVWRVYVCHGGGISSSVYSSTYSSIVVFIELKTSAARLSQYQHNSQHNGFNNDVDAYLYLATRLPEAQRRNELMCGPAVSIDTIRDCVRDAYCLLAQ